MGTLESGPLADITGIRGNPLFAIVALANVDVVVKIGEIYRDGAPESPRRVAGGAATRR